MLLTRETRTRRERAIILMKSIIKNTKETIVNNNNSTSIQINLTAILYSRLFEHLSKIYIQLLKCTTD